MSVNLFTTKLPAQHTQKLICVIARKLRRHLETRRAYFRLHEISGGQTSFVFWKCTFTASPANVANSTHISVTLSSEIQCWAAITNTQRVRRRGQNTRLLKRIRSRPMMTSSVLWRHTGKVSSPTLTKIDWFPTWIPIANDLWLKGTARRDACWKIVIKFNKK